MTNSERLLALIAAVIAIFAFATGIPSLRTPLGTTSGSTALPKAPSPPVPLETARRANDLAEDAEDKARRSAFALAEVNSELESILYRGWYPQEKERVERLLSLGADINRPPSVSFYSRNAQTDPDAIEFLRSKGYRFDRKEEYPGDLSICHPALMSTDELRTERGKRAFELLLTYGGATHCAIPVGYTYTRAVLDDPSFSVPDAIAGLAWIKGKGVHLNARITINDSWMKDPAERRTGRTLRDDLAQEAQKRGAVQQARLQPLLDYLAQ